VTRCLYVALVILVGAAVYTERAHAHLVERPKAPGLEARQVSQQANLAHARFVCNRGANANRRWHCVWVPILERELARTRYAIHVRQRRAQAQAAHNVPEPWLSLARCESGFGGPPRWHIATPPHYGGLQFTLSTWRAVGGSGYPHQHTPAEQVHRGRVLLSMPWGGWHHWPVCSRIVGLR
jgi:hypothetical protein